MTNAFDACEFCVHTFMEHYWVTTGDLHKVAKAAAKRQLERNYGLIGYKAQSHIEDLVSELYLELHEALLTNPQKFKSMLDAKRYAVRLLKTRVANLVVPMCHAASVPKSNKSIAIALGKKVEGGEVVKDKDGNWMPSEKYQLDPTHQEFLVGSTRKPVMEQIDWCSYDTQDGDGWYYPDVDRADLEYNLGSQIPLAYTDDEREYLLSAMAYTNGFAENIRDSDYHRNADRLSDQLREEQLHALALQPELLGHNGGPALDDADDELLEDLVAEAIGPLMGDLSPLEQKALVEVARSQALDLDMSESSNWAWYQAGEKLGKTEAHMRKLKQKIAAKASKYLPNNHRHSSSSKGGA